MEHLEQDTMINSPLAQLGLLRRLYQVIKATTIAHETRYIKEKSVLYDYCCSNKVQSYPSLLCNKGMLAFLVQVPEQ